MKIDKAQLVAFLKALDFTKAGGWDDTKLLDYARKIPEKVEPAAVDDAFRELYDELSNLGETELEFTSDTKPEGKAKPAKPKTQPKPEKNSQEEKPKKTEKPQSTQKAEPRKKKRVKPRAETKAAVRVHLKLSKPKPESDHGLISGAINKYLASRKGNWVTLAEVVKATRIPEKQVRNRLYAAMHRGFYRRQKAAITWQLA